MSFDTPNGTRGNRPPGAMSRLFNKLAISQIRRKGGKMMGMDTLVLTTIGRKSGLERTTPVVCFDGGEGSWLIVASAGGSEKNPAWYWNLAGHPDQVQVETAGRKVAVTADQLHGEDRTAAWQKITAAASRFAGYQKKTDRELPIIRLTPKLS